MNERRAFTLMEMLVAASVVLLLIALLMRMVGGVTSVISLCSDRSECDRQAALVFQQLASDFGLMLRRPDLDCSFEKRQGNDAMAFYCQVAGYGADDTHPQIASVGYRVGRDGPDKSGLVRGAQNCDWTSFVYSGSGVQSLEAPGSLVEIEDGNYQTLAANICRLEFWFVLKDGTLSQCCWTPRVQHQLSAPGAPTAQDDRARGYEPGSWWVQSGVAEFVCSDSTPGRARWHVTSKIANIAAVVVALAMVESRSHKLLPQAANGLNPEPVSEVLLDFNGESDLLTQWREQLAASPLPAAVQSAVRLYQGVIYLRTP